MVSQTNDTEAILREENRRLQSLSESLDRLVEIASESQSAERERILRHVFSHISHTGKAWQIILPVLFQIQKSCRSSFQRGAPAEQYAACRVSEVVAILLGANEEDYCEYHQYLWKYSNTKETVVRKAAWRAYGTMMLICADVDLRVAALDFYEARIVDDSVADILKAIAWECWSLILTLFPDDEIAGEHNGRGCLLLEQIILALESPSLELRTAAGQAATLLHEARLSNGNPHGNVTERQFDIGSWENSAYEDAINEIQQKIASLAVEHTNRMARKTRKTQRATFREFAAMLVDDIPPEEVIHFRHGDLEINSWKDLIVLNHLRAVLQGGFQIQLLTNPTVQRMLEVDASWIESQITDDERRKTSNKNSLAVKIADRDRRGKRDKRENIKNHFLNADDE